MSKEIVGFKPQSLYKNNSDVCPNCNNRTLSIPIGIEINEGFLGLGFKVTRKIEYTCDKCGCIWRVS